MSQDQQWEAPPDLQRPDWDPRGGCVVIKGQYIHNISCADARRIAAVARPMNGPNVEPIHGGKDA